MIPGKRHGSVPQGRFLSRCRRAGCKTGRSWIKETRLWRVYLKNADIYLPALVRPGAWLGKSRGGDARAWLAEQSAFDLCHAQEKLRQNRVKIRPAVQA